jgi:hypothetical protein
MNTISRHSAIRLGRRFRRIGMSILVVPLLAFAAQSIEAAGQVSCPAGVNPKSSMALAEATSDTGCTLKMSAGYPLPDPSCTPGAINPTVSLSILKSGKFKTSCERDAATTSKKKQTTYGTYVIKKPAQNMGQKQTCELDHLVSLELGGADTLDNIWPQCGPGGAKLTMRYFKIKDGVENYLAAKVKAGDISLKDAQRGIATNWTQFIDQAKTYRSTHVVRGFGRDQ